MGFLDDFETGEDTSGGGGDGGNFCKEAGFYHVQLRRMLDGEGRNGAVLAGIWLEFEICSGTVEGQASKSISFTLFYPKAGDKNDGAFPKKKITNLLLAVDAISPDDRGKRVKVDTADLEGRQCCVKVEKNENGYLELNYADVFHVDDPRAKAVPKSEEFLALIPPAFRHGAEYFEAITARKPAAAPVTVSDDEAMGI